MKTILSALFFLSTTAHYSQGADKKIKAVDWNAVEVYAFQAEHFPDSLQACGEWYIDGSAANLEDLNAATLEKIKKQVAENGCPMAYVDVKNFYNSRQKNKLYVMGLKKKE